MKRRRNQGGYATLPAVTGLTLMVTLSLTMLFKSTLLNRDQASRSQLKTDYHQREQALMRALVAVFPAKAIACMKADHANLTGHSWSTIFSQAVALSSVSNALPPEVLERLGLQSVRSGDVGDHTSAQVESWITSLTGAAGRVTPGTTAYADVFAQPAFAGKVPPLLDMSQALQDADAVRPVVTPQKRYATQWPGLLASVASHPVYNLIPYPHIRFGYAAPGQPFVAKHNWWAFTVNYGCSARTVARHYVLSLYEIPSQMPIEAGTFANIGRHEDGTSWNSTAIHIDGSVYADSMSVEGSFGASRLAGRSGIELADTLNLGGVDVASDFDALGVRERMQAERGSDMLPVALSANSGRMTFMPLKPGPQFLQRAPAGATFNAWDNYTAGAQRCPVTVEATAMVSYADQTPTALRVRFLTPAGTTGQVTLQRGSTWPTPFEAGGPALPFQTELTNNSRACLTFQPALLNAWLLSKGGAAVATNSSIYFGVDPAASPSTVRVAATPPAPEDMCVIIRKGLDLTSYTAGLSVLAPLRVYVGDDLNAVPAAAPPAGSGLPAGTVYYPPMSIFAAELRVGTTAFNRPIEHHGQLSTLNTSGAAAWQPLDMKSGSDDAVHSDTISAELAPLRSPAELPPIYQMNWLVVIEEIPQD